mmetsp:Transcript_33309/g.75321  ORF Transcript_33309/g.75321 Transcript_33309/m.75321 type:complete len:102 (+) Transcript_33309:132-437(+)
MRFHGNQRTLNQPPSTTLQTSPNDRTVRHSAGAHSVPRARHAERRSRRENQGWQPLHSTVSEDAVRNILSYACFVWTSAETWAVVAAKYRGGFHQIQIHIT